MLTAVVNTSAGPNNYTHNTDESAIFLANRRHRIMWPVSSPLADDKETNGGETKADCVQDYSPCSCSLNSNNKTVTCNGISVQTIHDVFQRVSDPEIYELKWTRPLPNNETNTISVPADFLGYTSTGRIYIECNTENRLNLVIDPFAFRLSQNSLAQFSVRFFDFGLQTNFNFLNGFDKLEELSFFSINNLTAFQYLPPLPSLQNIFISYCPEISQIAFPDLSSAKLKKLELNYNQISDDKADEIVAKLARSNSANSLAWLDLWGNSLTRIPSQVGSAFPELERFNLNNNKIVNIPSASFTFVSRYLDYLGLYQNRIKTIESGAFRGKLTSARAISLFFCLTNRIT